MLDSIDHVVMQASSLQNVLDFYEAILELPVVEFQPKRYAIMLKDQKINIHFQGSDIQPVAKQQHTGTLDVCFITSKPLDEIKDRLDEYGVEVISYNVQRVGATGLLRSLYCYDYDGNLLEIANPL